MQAKTFLALGATCVALAACGGGGSDGGDSLTSTTNTSTTAASGGSGVPQSAQSSVAGLLAYLQSLIAGSNETDSPVSLDGVTLPVDETGPASAI